jgi:hypothetical protein
MAEDLMADLEGLQEEDSEEDSEAVDLEEEVSAVAEALGVLAVEDQVAVDLEESGDII